MNHFTRPSGLNPKFGDGGVVVLPEFDTIQDRHVIDSVMQGDDIIAGASAFTIDGPAPNYFAMARFTKDGALDNAFGKKGTVTGQFENSSHSGCEAIGTADEDNGSIWMLGWYKNYETDNAKIGLLRFDRNAQEKMPHPLDQPENTKLVTLNSALSILGHSVMAAANFTEIDGTPSQTRVYRLDLQGNPGFGGKQYIDISHEQGLIRISSLIQQADAFLIGGHQRQADGNDYGFIARYLTNGDLDLTFANGAGFYSFLADSAHTRINQLILRPDGRLLALGEAQRSALPRTDAMIMQLTANGRVDPAFNRGQPVFAHFHDAFSTYRSGALGKDGKLTVVGHSEDITLFALRYHVDGAQDTSFSLGIPLYTNETMTAFVRAEDTLIAMNTTGAAGLTGMIFSFLNQ